MSSNLSWLGKLKNAELHRLAISIGTACSGTKAERIRGIENVLQPLRRDHGTIAKTPIIREKAPKYSLISIDMGIRNLAYAHFTSDTLHDESEGLQLPCLNAWKRLQIGVPREDLDKSQRSIDEITTIDHEPDLTTPKESFEPIDLALHAYHFIQKILYDHEPTHILIERQRFRSGGHAAVQEWTIRVGVFEGMLYASLKTFAEMAGLSLVVEPVLPTRVNRFWLGENGVMCHTPESTKADDGGRLSGKQIKSAKIDVVTHMLKDLGKPGAWFTVEEQMKQMVSDFIEARNKVTGRKSAAKSVSSLKKLDDLSDCLLQGLARLQWETNRWELLSKGRDVLND